MAQIRHAERPDGVLGFLAAVLDGEGQGAGLRGLPGTGENLQELGLHEFAGLGIERREGLVH